MYETRRIEAKDGSFIIVYMGTAENNFELELTWMRDMERPYNLGDCEFHLAFEAADKKHKEMGIYFIQDPDGYWLEIIPRKEQ